MNRKEKGTDNASTTTTTTTSSKRRRIDPNLKNLYAEIEPLLSPLSSDVKVTIIITIIIIIIIIIIIVIIIITKTTLYTCIREFLDASKEDDKKIITELANEVRQLSVYASYEDNSTNNSNNNNNNSNDDDESISLLSAENNDIIIDEKNTSTTINTITNSNINKNTTSSTRKKANGIHFSLYHVLCSFIIGILMMVGTTSYIIRTDTDTLDSIKDYIKNNIKK